jgi:hypothetical protein
MRCLEVAKFRLLSWLSGANFFRRHIDAVWRHKMNGNEDMQAVFVVNIRPLGEICK